MPSKSRLKGVAVYPETRDVINTMCQKMNHPQYVVIDNIFNNYFNEHPDKVDAFGLEILRNGATFNVRVKGKKYDD